MKKYYTRVCNFHYGGKSAKLINQKKTLPLNGNNQISFDQPQQRQPVLAYLNRFATQNF